LTTTSTSDQSSGGFLTQRRLTNEFAPRVEETPHREDLRPACGEKVAEGRMRGSCRKPSQDFATCVLATRLLLVGLLLSMASACVYVPRVMWSRAESNRQHIDQVVVGQSLADVRQIMGKDPEKREVRARFDGKTVEFWSYVTDYGRRLDSTITFIDGKVQEIRTTPWMEAD